MRITRKTYKNYAGALIVGSNKVVLSDRAVSGEHMARAFYLTAVLEAPKWGTIQSYDGAAMSGGPMHWVAVLPKTVSQGPLFKLLRRLELDAGARFHASQDISRTQQLDDLFLELANEDMFVARDGVLRDSRNGRAISGKRIRDTLTPTGGKVGTRGSFSWKTTEKWAALFYDLLSAPWTYSAQMDHSIEYLIRGAATEELYCYRYWLPELATPEVLYTANPTDQGYTGPTDVPCIPDAVDFAMCVYHSFTPNAPGMARVVLKRVIKAYEAWLCKRLTGPNPRWKEVLPKLVAAHDPDGRVFAKLLIKKMGTTQYGNWHDRPHQSGARYDRARKYAKTSGLWPMGYFANDGLMPLDLKK